MTAVHRAQEQESAAAPAVDVRQTRFKDVCGSIDELKRVLCEEPERAAADGARPLRNVLARQRRQPLGGATVRRARW